MIAFYAGVWYVFNSESGIMYMLVGLVIELQKNKQMTIDCNSIDLIVQKIIPELNLRME